MNVIFGSGAIGLLAKLILGDDWKIIPFGRSRFFSFNPALDDNFIAHHSELDPFIKQLTSCVGDPPTYWYRRKWSIGGELIDTFDDGVCNDWLSKIFGNNVPPQSKMYIKNSANISVYDIRVNKLYYSLLNKYMPELKQEAEKGHVTEVGPHYFVRNGVKEEFDNAVNTIPLDVLCKLMNIDIDLPSKTLHYVHLETEDLDFEGANQVFVADGLIDFWKVTNIAPNRYLFYFHNDVDNYGVYLMSFMKKFECLDGTAIEGALPMGITPDMVNIEKGAGIFSVGSYAQWDWCMDVGSCILRLIRYANRGNKPKKPNPL